MYHATGGGWPCITIDKQGARVSANAEPGSVPLFVYLSSFSTRTSLSRYQGPFVDMLTPPPWPSVLSMQVPERVVRLTCPGEDDARG